MDINLCLCNREPLSKFIRCLNAKPLVVFIVAAIVSILVDSILAMIFGAWLPQSNNRGLTTDYQSWGYEFIITPLILAYFVWIQKSGSELFQKLLGEGIVPASKITTEEITVAVKRLGSPIIGWMGLILGLILTIWLTYAYIPTSLIATNSSSWLAAHPGIVYIKFPLHFIIYYALVITIIDFVLVVLSLSRILSRQKIKVEPLNPDGAGGLSSIGHFSANFGYALGGVGIVLSATIISDPLSFIKLGIYGLLTDIITYLIIMPVVFFPPSMQHIKL